MSQLVGWRDEDRTVRDLLLALSPAPLQRAGADARRRRGRQRARPGRAHRARARARPTPPGATRAAGTPRCSGTPARRSRCASRCRDAGARRLSTLSGGEQKRLALEVLLRSDADVLLLDEPDNYLDVAGKLWLEDALRASAKTMLIISHDRALLDAVADKVVTLEGRTAWTHGASFATWHEARDARIARIDEDAPPVPRGAQAAGGVAAGVPAPRVDGQRRVRVARAVDEDQDRAVRGDGADRARPRRAGVDAARRQPHRHARRHLRAARARRAHRPVRLRGRSSASGSRCSGPNGTGKSHFLRLLAGEPVEHAGRGGSARGSSPATSPRPTTSPSCAASRCSTR